LAGRDIDDQLPELDRVTRALIRRSTIALPASHYGRPWLDVPFEDGNSKDLAFGLAFALPNAMQILSIDLLDGHDCTAGFEADGISYSETHASSP
jgi:hypothetical protein